MTHSDSTARPPMPDCWKMRWRLVLAWIACFAGFLGTTAAESTRPPNIVFILTDDLGIGDLGCYGQTKIRTPNIDRLAREGFRLTTHYSGNAVCAPSRCVLLTGKHPGHAWIRSNREVQPEGQEPLPDAEVTLAELLSGKGYATGAFGKWGLGPVGSEGEPARQGFARFFGYNCQRAAHNYYPTYLWDNSQRVNLRNPAFAPHQKLPPGADPAAPESYAQYRGEEYAPDLISKQALDFIREHKERPFFLFYPTTVPHLALQVPEDSLAEYADAFPEEPYPGGKGYLPHRTPRAAYAAMITRMDREVGRMIDLVAELGLESQTIFIFSSDNGPLANRLGGTDTDFFQSAANLRGRKGSLYEGGVRVPCIIRWKGTIQPGTSDRVTGFEDWLPTLLELTGIDERPPGIDGISFAPTLRGEKQEPREFLYREFPGYGGQQMVRKGKWKAVRQKLHPTGQGNRVPVINTELYDLEADPAEANDVASKHPEVVRELEAILAREHVKSEIFPIRALDQTNPK